MSKIRFIQEIYIIITKGVLCIPFFLQKENISEENTKYPNNSIAFYIRL